MTCEIDEKHISGFGSQYNTPLFGILELLTLKIVELELSRILRRFDIVRSIQSLDVPSFR